MKMHELIAHQLCVNAEFREGVVSAFKEKGFDLVLPELETRREINPITLGFRILDRNEIIKSGDQWILIKRLDTGAWIDVDDSVGNTVSEYNLSTFRRRI